MTIKSLTDFLKKKGIGPTKLDICKLDSLSVAIDMNYLVGRIYSLSKRELIRSTKLEVAYPNDEDVIPIAIKNLGYFIRNFTDNNVDVILCYDGVKSDLKLECVKKRRKDREKTKDKLEQVKQDISDSCAFSSAHLYDKYARYYENHYNYKIVSMILEQSKREFNNRIMVAGEVGPGNPEAEALCASLVHNGVCVGAYSADSDLFAYGTGLIIRNVNRVKTEEGYSVILDVYSYSSVLKGLGFTDEQFVDFCIMCGTDFNDNIRGIGPVRSYNLIKEHLSIDNVTKTDTTILNHNVVRQIFSSSRQRFNYS